MLGLADKDQGFGVVLTGNWEFCGGIRGKVLWGLLGSISGIRVQGLYRAMGLGVSSKRLTAQPPYPRKP